MSLFLSTEARNRIIVTLILNLFVELILPILPETFLILNVNVLTYCPCIQFSILILVSLYVNNVIKYFKKSRYITFEVAYQLFDELH